jgi:hypothetical protein
MRELFPDGTTAPAELMAPAPDRPGWQQVELAPAPATLDEILRKLYFETVNTKQADGRINGGLDRNGDRVYYFVSPYSKRFWENVEPGVVPLVKALQSKRYLTYSSCEGHCLVSRRYVGVAFADQASREAFCQPIEAAKLPGVIIRRLESVANQTAEVTESGTVRLVKQAPDPAKEATSFNFAFGRSYEDYCFAEVIVCDTLPASNALMALIRNPFRHAPTIWRKALFWSRITEQLAELIRSDAVPRYPY